MNVATAAVGYYWGDDGYGIEQAARGLGLRAALAQGSDADLERWRTVLRDDTIGSILERVATSTMFGGGTLAVVTDAMAFGRSRAGLDTIRGLLGSVAPGNALAIVDEIEEMPSEKKGPGATRLALIKVVEEASGEVRRLDAPDTGQMTGWILRQAKDREVRLGPAAAQELATRVGGLAYGGDIDRRNQGRLAVGELDKLSLLHVDGGEITVDDVRALVAETSPNSVWGFLDALGNRLPQTTTMLDRLLASTPEPLLLAQLYTRIRQLLDVTDRLAGGADPRAVVRETKLNPYVAEKLARMSPRWTVGELRAALDGLFALDVLVKGADGGTSTEEGRRLAFTLWLTETIG